MISPNESWFHPSRRTFLQQLAGATALSLAGGSRLGAIETSGPLSLVPAMDKAAHCCLAWLNPQEHFLPTGGYEVAHDTGRWWDAMLRYEAATQKRIPEAAEQAMKENLRELTDNSAGLLASKLCNPHNLRESMLTYTALARWRDDEWARKQGAKLVATLLELLEPDGQLNYEKLAERVGKPLTKDPLMTQRSAAGEWFNATGTTGRALESIVWFYEATGHKPARELADRLAEIHLRQIIDPSGEIPAELLDPTHVGHTHSYCGTLRGLLLYGFNSGDQRYVQAVSQTYRKGLWQHVISHSGWNPHDQGKMRFSNKEGEPIGEHASAGDVAQIALWLALRGGEVDLLDDVERLIRARLLPSQINEPANPRRDGAWGVYQHPFGFGSILDVFAAVLHTFCDVQQSIVRTDAGKTSVDLHFDTETPEVAVTAQRDQSALLRIVVKMPNEIRLRVPGWVSRESISLAVNGKPKPLRWDRSFVVVSKDEIVAGNVIELRHDLPESDTVEEMPISHRQFHLRWRGDTVVGCDPKVPIYS